MRELAKKYPMIDPVKHSYIPFYGELFASHRSVTSVLEIGVNRGGSLRLWRDYFCEAKIYGIDIEPKFMIHGEDRIYTFIANHDSPAEILDFAKKYGPFDIIIEDGSHRMESQKNLITWLWPYTTQIYITEDLCTSLVPGFGKLDELSTALHKYERILRGMIPLPGLTRSMLASFPATKSRRFKVYILGVLMK